MKLQALRWQSLPWFKASRPQWRYALRNGIAMCLALSIAYALDLDEPYWAMTSAAVVSFPTVGGDRLTVFYRRLAAPFCVDMKAVFARRKRA